MQTHQPPVSSSPGLPIPPQQSPISPMVNSPRVRPGFGESYPQQTHQMNMVRSQSINSQSSFSPSSPSIHPGAIGGGPGASANPMGGECYQSSPSTPRPQSTEHGYNQSLSPYAAHPRTPSNLVGPFSPSHHHMQHQQQQQSIEQYPMGPHTPGDMSDIYKMATPQHSIGSKPQTPSDTYAPSLPTTPQPPQSPQIAIPSPLNDIYARSPATPRPSNATVGQRGPSSVSGYADESGGYNPNRTNEIYPPSQSGNYPPQFMSPNSYSMSSGDGFVGPNTSSKAGMVRPQSVRPSIPMRRQPAPVSLPSNDPYARQPMTPMPGSQVDPDSQGDQYSRQLQLRNLLQHHPNRPSWPGKF